MNTEILLIEQRSIKFSGWVGKRKEKVRLRNHYKNPIVAITIVVRKKRSM